MTVTEALKSLSNYPVPTVTLLRVAAERGLDPAGEMNAGSFADKKYKLAEADILTWISNAPSFSEGGVSISYSEKDKAEMRSKAERVYKENGETTGTVQFGYKGSTL